MKRVISISLAVGLALGSVVAGAASVPTIRGPLDPGNMINTLNGIIQSINQNTVGIGDPVGGALSGNFLANGAMNISQRGTADTTGGVAIGGCGVTNYVADRWCADSNIAAGNNHGQVITATPSPPKGFLRTMKIWRSAGVTTQAQCAMQAISSGRAVAMRGQRVMFSAYVQPLAGLSAVNGTVFAVLATGTSADEGMATLTAAPAVTPAFTGLVTNTLTAGAGSPSWDLGTTAAWSRIYSAPVLMPNDMQEGSISLCFTPAATGSGATDGFAFVGAQLEALGPNQVAPSNYQFLAGSFELEEAQRYYYQITEPAASISVSPAGQGASTTTCILSIPHPVEMRAAPTFAAAGTALANTTWTVTHVVTNTVLSTPFLAVTTGGNTTRLANLTATTGATLTAGQTCTLTGAAGGSILTFSADL
jgi:hypothetical protein